MPEETDNVDFINLVLMLAQTASMSLGETPRFISGKKIQNLPHARQVINMIKILQEKTKGHLTAGETKLLFRVLGDLQQKYVAASGLNKLHDETTHDSKTGLEKALDKLSTDDLAKIIAEVNKFKNEPNK
jgi:hypothetical protein